LINVLGILTLSD